MMTLLPACPLFAAHGPWSSTLHDSLFATHAPLLSVGWLAPAMLGWLAVAAAPLLIHLWSRRNYRETSWAAMECLLAAMRRQTRRIRFEQWLLLAVRTLLVVLVVVAVAEPRLESAWPTVSPGGRVHRILAIDGSYSMGYQLGGKTRFDRAKDVARRIVQESSAGDAFTLVLMGAQPRLSATAVDAAAMLDEIDRLRLPHAGANLRATVALVRRVVESVGREKPRWMRHEVYLVTDMQRASWSPAAAEPARADFLRQSGELARAASLVVLDVGQPAENRAVTSLELLEWPVTVGRSVSLRVRIKDFGLQGRKGQPVELRVDGRRMERKEMDVPPGGEASATFDHRFRSPGEHLVEVCAPGDALEVDNCRRLAVPVREAVRTLCIEGRPAGGAFHGAADYLAVALAPRAGQAGPSEHAPVQADVAPESAILERNLANYDGLFLCNVAQFTASEAKAVDAYLRAGGNVILFLGDQVSAERYHRALGVAGMPAGLGLLPAEIGPLVEQPQLRLDPLGNRHPILQAFRGRGQASLLTTPVFKHYRLKTLDGSRAVTVLKLADGDPLIVEQPVHRGRVIVVATSAEPSWTALPLWPSFVPLVQEMVAYCLAGEMRQRNLTVGEPIETPATTGRTLAVQAADGRTSPMTTRIAEDSLLSYADTSESGVYTVRGGTPSEHDQLFAVNVDTMEGDLSRVEPETLRSRTWTGVPFAYRSIRPDAAEAGIRVAVDGGTALPTELLWAALGLLLVETWLGWKMGYHDPAIVPGLDEGVDA
ncbi:MAG: BatA domain-containing protein [Thermoguttaceae bacterium]